MKFFFTCLTISMLFCFCDNSDPSTKRVSGDSVSNSVDSLSNQSSNKHLPSDTTNTMSLAKDWNKEFVFYDLPLNTREIIWLKAGAKHLRNRKMATVARNTITIYGELNKGLNSYMTAHRDLQPPEVDTLNTVDLGDQYGPAWDRSWIKKITTDQDNLLNMINKSLPSITDSSILQVVNKELPQIRSAQTALKRLE